MNAKSAQKSNKIDLTEELLLAAGFILPDDYQRIKGKHRRKLQFIAARLLAWLRLPPDYWDSVSAVQSLRTGNSVTIHLDGKPLITVPPYSAFSDELKEFMKWMVGVDSDVPGSGTAPAGTDGATITSSSGEELTGDQAVEELDNIWYNPATWNWDSLFVNDDQPFFGTE